MAVTIPVTVTASASGKRVKFDVPARVKPGATELSLVNNTKEPVELQIVRLDEGHTLAEFYPALESEAAPIPTWLHAFGGVGETSPGQTRTAVVDLEAGSYAWFSNTSPEQEGAQPLYKRGGEEGPGGRRRHVGGPSCRRPPPRSRPRSSARPTTGSRPAGSRPAPTRSPSPTAGASCTT
jgi:hypothetical protein